MADSVKNTAAFDWQQNVEDRGIQASHYLTGVALELPLQKRRILVQHIKSEMVASAFHHNPARCATQIRDYLTYDLWNCIQKSPKQSHCICQTIEAFSTWAAIQAPAVSSTIQKMFRDILPEDKAPTMNGENPVALQVCRNGMSMDE